MHSILFRGLKSIPLLGVLALGACGPAYVEVGPAYGPPPIHVAPVPLVPGYAVDHYRYAPRRAMPPRDFGRREDRRHGFGDRHGDHRRQDLREQESRRHGTHDGLGRQNWR